MSGCGERQTETDRKRERQRETERQRKTDSDSETERDRERQRESERDRGTIDNAQLSEGVGRGKGTSDGSKGRRHLRLVVHEHYGLAPLLHLSLEPPVQLLGRQLPQAFTACGVG
jgi:hypothetical protein